MLRCFLRGLAMYGIAHAGRGPVDGVDDFYRKPEKTKEASNTVDPVPATLPSSADTLPKSEEGKK